MYRLCIKYTEAKLEALADLKGYASADEMCEDLALDKDALLTHYVPLDITTEAISDLVYTKCWFDKVYAIVDNEVELEPIVKTTLVWKCHTNDVVWIDEDEFLDHSMDMIIPLQNL